MAVGAGRLKADPRREPQRRATGCRWRKPGRGRADRLRRRSAAGQRASPRHRRGPHSAEAWQGEAHPDARRRGSCRLGDTVRSSRGWSAAVATCRELATARDIDRAKIPGRRPARRHRCFRGEHCLAVRGEISRIGLNRASQVLRGHIPDMGLAGGDRHEQRPSGEDCTDVRMLPK